MANQITSRYCLNTLSKKLKLLKETVGKLPPSKDVLPTNAELLKKTIRMLPPSNVVFLTQKQNFSKPAFDFASLYASLGESDDESSEPISAESGTVIVMSDNDVEGTDNNIFLNSTTDDEEGTDSSSLRNNVSNNDEEGMVHDNNETTTGTTGTTSNSLTIFDLDDERAYDQLGTIWVSHPKYGKVRRSARLLAL